MMKTQTEYKLTPIQLRIFEELSSGASTTRKELVKSLKTARTTIFDNLVKLQNNELVRKYSRCNGLRGRPIVYWYIPKIILQKIRR